MSLVGLSHPRAITRIPDPIHGVIELTLFDRDIVDSKSFQRLHFVLQQSVNYVSFPANKNTRFPHSLGAAHIAGRMFSNALSNSDVGVLREFLECAGVFMHKLINCIFLPSGGVKKVNSCDEIYMKLKMGHDATISGISGFLHTPLMKQNKDVVSNSDWRVDSQDRAAKEQDFSVNFIVDTLWQALKIYALSHDIGHLPMSHAFENAVENVTSGISEYSSDDELKKEFGKLVEESRNEFSGFEDNKDQMNFFNLLKHMIGAENQDVVEYVKNKPLHEVRSFAILNKLLTEERRHSECFPELSSEEKDAMDDYGSLIHNFTLCLIYSPCMLLAKGSKDDKVNPASFLYAIRQLVDGVVDADRLDYTLRDCRESGSHFGDFDLERIIRNTMILKENGTEENEPRENIFAFGYGPIAVAGIEQFFEARYQSYKYQVYHRTASRSNIVVENLIEKLFVFSTLYPDSKCADIMEHYQYIQISEDRTSIERILPVVTDAIERFDDCSLRTSLHEIRHLFGDPTNLEKISHNAIRHHIAREIAILCDIVLFRDLRHIITLFRHHTPDSLLENYLEIDDVAVRESFLNRLILDQSEWITALRKSVVPNGGNHGENPISFMFELVKPKIFTNKNPSLEAFEKTIWVREPKGTVIELGHKLVSAGLHGMAAERNNEHRVRIYAVSENLKIDEDQQKRVESVFLETLKTRYENFRQQTIN